LIKDHRRSPSEELRIQIVGTKSNRVYPLVGDQFGEVGLIHVIDYDR